MLMVAQLQGTSVFVSAACSFDTVSVDTNPGFKITVNGDYKLLEDTVAQVSYGLYCDTQPSNVEGVDKWFKVPVSSVAIRTPMASGFIEALGQRAKITAAESPDTLTNICLDTEKLKSIANGSIQDDKDVDVVFSSDADSDGKKSVRLPTDDTLEPLQKAEWIKFVSAFFNVEKTAGSLFTSISDSYNCHESNLKNVKTLPHAYWVQYSETDGNKNYGILTTAYQKKLLASAGATNETKEGLKTSDVNKFQEAVKDANHVFDQTELTNNGLKVTEWYKDFGYKDPMNSGADFLEQRQLWRTELLTSKSGANNFPEFAYVRPDIVLQDVISVMFPTYNSKYTRRWVSWLGGTNENTVVMSSENFACSGTSWLVAVDKCTARTDFVGEADPSDETPDGDDKGKGKDDEKDGDEKDGDKKDGEEDDSNDSSSHGRGGKIAGGVVAGVAFIVLAFFGVHYYNKHRQHARLRSLSEGAYGNEHIGLQRTSHMS
ncbi:hypothetical protein GGI07_005547 [Coemansia sp. Benny D115]|nr:hypothetical protein GGI07_005547 [Coemansia sp. Benny D115]